MADMKYHEKIKALYGVPDVMVKEPERLLLTAIGRTTAWRMERDGKFPKRRTQSSNHVSWSMADLMEWVDNRDGGA